MKVALVGLTQSGKSTLLSAISGKTPSPSGTNQIDQAVVPVPDERIDWLTKLYQPAKSTYASIDCLDLPGLSFIDDSGRTAARRLLSQIRTVDMFVLVIRAFSDESVSAYRASVDPQRDIRELLSEFLLSDLELISTRIDKLQIQVKKGGINQAQDQEELTLQLKLQEVLENNRPLNTLTLNTREEEILRPLGLLTLKPISIVVNVDETTPADNSALSDVVERCVPITSLCAKIEAELAILDPESRQLFMEDLGIKESAVGKFVRGCYSALGLISFLTVGPDEVRAWPLQIGSSALDAAGKIHSDIKRGFIRAETMSYADLHSYGDEKKLRAAGKFRLEGKSYTIQDGDILNFRFNL